ncbi:MAG TPA: S8 family serine peptidase, partial [Steroidobacteraceae bacterium]|nr:S8 family serine peptidase [Steroidobacteraceae bacterium]
LGKCGGYDSDIVAAMQWAAGISISGVPDNQTPAKVINMSLGSVSACSEPYASLITQLTAMDVVVVASAGNEGGSVDEPANCPGAIAVAGVRHAGTKVGYSSIGLEVAIAAPAGNCVNLNGACLFELTTTTNAGSQQPIAGGTYTDQGFSANIGTSFSAPLTAGVAALMFAANDSLSAVQIRARMREGATTFPIGAGVPTCHVPAHLSDFQTEECTCTTSTCGAGMLHAENAVRAAQRPNAKITLPSIVTSGASVTLDGSISAPATGRTLTTFAWSVHGTCDTTAPTPTSVNQSGLVLNAPMVGLYFLQLVVTDSLGAVDSSYVTLSASSATSTDSAPSCPATPAVTPPSSGGSGGGGGSLTLSLLLLLLGLRALQNYVGISRTSFCKY